jgi:predicted pyridoxine 5'-phosphate oxidase superfamily flavin-nucleotide-binding protein
MPTTFQDIITTEAQIRELLGEPPERVIAKVSPTIDKHCRDFIARSPFVVLASSGANGNVDVSAKGDPAGFVQVLDDHTLAIPDRLGNRRADTLRKRHPEPQRRPLLPHPRQARNPSRQRHSHNCP